MKNDFLFLFVIFCGEKPIERKQSQRLSLTDRKSNQNSHAAVYVRFQWRFKRRFLRPPNIYYEHRPGQLWPHIETLNFTWLDAARRVVQDGMKKILVGQSFRDVFWGHHTFSLWISWRQLWPHIEALNFIWLDAARRIMQDDMKKILVVLSLKWEQD